MSAPNAQLQKTPAELIADCERHWGKAWRHPKELLEESAPLLSSFWNFDTAPDLVKAQVAQLLVFQTTPTVGAFFDIGNGFPYLRRFAFDMTWTRGLFDADRTGNVRAAALLASYASPRAMSDATETEVILGGGGALAASYLLPQLEYVFRYHSRYLDRDGTVTRTIPAEFETYCSEVRPRRVPNVGQRVNGIQTAFRLFLYRNPSHAARYLKLLQKKLNLVKRFSRIRNPALHGSLADASFEALFYGLVMAVLYYCESRGH